MSSERSERMVCGCRNPHSDEECPKAIPEWMRARRRRVAEALRQADRDSAPLFGYLWSQWHADNEDDDADDEDDDGDD